MKNYLVQLNTFSKDLAKQVFQKLNQVRYGISCHVDDRDIDLTLMRLELANWQKQDDGDALCKTSINYITWMPVSYDDDTTDPELMFNQQQGGSGYIVGGTERKPNSFKINYNYGAQTDQNIVEINSGGCLTRINLNPAITINYSKDFTFVQSEPSDLWVILHNLGFIPNVLITDVDGNEIEGAVIPISTSEIHIQFSRPVAGKAYLS